MTVDNNVQGTKMFAVEAFQHCLERHCATLLQHIGEEFLEKWEQLVHTHHVWLFAKWGGVLRRQHGKREPAITQEQPDV